MIKINLLPVKKVDQGSNLKLQAALAAALILSVLSVCGYFLSKVGGEIKRMNAQIAKVKDETESLQRIIGEIDKIKERKADLEKKLSVIDGLEQGRLTTVKTMEFVSRAAPDQLWFDKFELKDTNLQISGFALDNQIIALFIQNLAKDPSVSAIVLRETSQAKYENMDVVKFSLTFSVKTPDKQG